MKNIKKIRIILIVTCFLLLTQLFAGEIFALNFETETSYIDEILTEENIPVMARGCGNYNLPDDFLNGGRWTDSWNLISNHLNQYHEVDPHIASTRLHSIKHSHGLPANYNCIFDYTGGVYDQNGASLGSLVE